MTAIRLLLPIIHTFLCFRPTFGRGSCEYGSVPGYWWASRYKSFSKDCKFRRLVEQHSPTAVKAQHVTHGRHNKTHVLLIGDSLDRNVVIALSEWSGRPFRDYTPMRFLPDGRPQKIGRSCFVEFANHTYANLFIFAANNQKEYYSLWKGGKSKGMSDGTYDRVCRDGPQFLPYFPDHSPYLISVNSAYWEVARWERYHGRINQDIISLNSKQHHGKTVRAVTESFNVSVPLKLDDLPTLQHSSSIRLGVPPFLGMVMRHPQKRNEPDYMKQLLNKFHKDMVGLMDKVEECFPETKVYCWRTAPRVATDDRIHHFFYKRPHIMAALNQLARFVAKERGWCILDMDMMLQGYGNNEEFVPDGAHPAAWVNLEYANVILNIIEQHKHDSGQGSSTDGYAEEDEHEDPELREMIRKTIRDQEAYRETEPQPMDIDEEGEEEQIELTA